MTGSGKTELYLRATAEAIRRGRQAIILVPEIAITPQMVRRFLARFPGQVGLIHSRLSDGERYDTWRRARLGLLKVVIGPRSALFAPLPNVGLIVADECHDGSYYQSEPPFYHAVEAAKVYARLCGAVCILGSATPTIQQRYQAGGGESILLELPKRIQTSSSSGRARRAAACLSHRYARGTQVRPARHLQPGAGGWAGGGAQKGPAGDPLSQPARYGHLRLLPAMRHGGEVPAV